MAESTLEPVWRELLKIYKVFVEICDRHGLRHYVTDGCAIGAVRHRGFIPWDDDLDVSMPRPDYDIFMRVAKEELPANLVAFDRHQCPELNVLFGKVQETREEKVHEVENKIGHILSNGLYIDIFPIDGCPASFFGTLWLRLRFLTLLGVQRYIEKRFWLYSWRGRIMWLWGWFCSALFLKIKTISDVAEAKERLGRRYDYEKSSKVMRLPSGTTRLVIQDVHDKKIWGDGRVMRFCDLKVTLPSEYDEYLRSMYGDYMKIPPAEKRISTHVGDKYFPWWLGPRGQAEGV